MRKLVNPRALSMPISFDYSKRFALTEPCRAKKHRNIMIAIMMKKIVSSKSSASLLD